jgi:hypothetical protein
LRSGRGPGPTSGGMAPRLQRVRQPALYSRSIERTSSRSSMSRQPPTMAGPRGRRRGVPGRCELPGRLPRCRPQHFRRYQRLLARCAMAANAVRRRPVPRAGIDRDADYRCGLPRRSRLPPSSRRERPRCDSRVSPRSGPAVRRGRGERSSRPVQRNARRSERQTRLRVAAQIDQKEGPG